MLKFESCIFRSKEVDELPKGGLSHAQPQGCIPGTGLPATAWDIEMVIGDIPETTLNFQIILDNWDMDQLQVKAGALRASPPLTMNRWRPPF